MQYLKETTIIKPEQSVHTGSSTTGSQQFECVSPEIFDDVRMETVYVCEMLCLALFCILFRFLPPPSSSPGQLLIACSPSHKFVGCTQRVDCVATASPSQIGLE
jgi:hypothetical protein